jgi:hypothetical protein
MPQSLKPGQVSRLMRKPRKRWKSNEIARAVLLALLILILFLLCCR